MVRSLYTRVVLIFLASVIGGTLISFLLAAWIFEDKLNENLQIPMIYFGQDIARMYGTFPADEASAYVSGMSQLKMYNLRFFDETGEYESFGEPNEYQPATVTKEQINLILNGDVVQVNRGVVSTTLVGLPFTSNGETKAMFIDQRTPTSNTLAIQFLLNFSIYTLVTGSLVILVATKFLVNPIKKLTDATRHIAGGNFNIRLNIKQKGELGALAQSFEEMTRDLQQVEQLRRDFVSNVSHEVQSPLTSITGYAKALKQMNLPDRERDRYLDIIISEAERMSKMSDGLLKLSLLESQSQQLQFSTFSLDEQIRRVIVALQPQWSARSISFELQLKPIQMEADYDLLNQVWTNILGNSIKFSNEGGAVTVSIRQDSRSVIVRITDTGIGISPEDQRRIFERFFKADRSHSRQNGGSGMGLAIVKQIVMLHSGDIRAESESGKGTSIIITLPLKPPTGQANIT
ncbi:histidine kinase [Paenibacillus sp. FSL R7-0273]|uniref:sensor histidine kinase n=1 Tax=Paenibacillus sp. FSL R7-0273 TaxID=1536772 RepID=UPI0004F88E45|nr:HAMP domain-containing sensor histidine kinase [Paenibacillus sp. FSL R7-0273]AIQ47377.1 histidine kinase [Paenibacillus sp. FSL R7-0273]OMF96067.1 two-component sensor histidine kinase [Paenibacillus sp. FSL R7-0273]